MDDISIGLLITVLAGLTLLGAFFSGAETGIVSLNRYKLRHLIKKNHRAAKLVDFLLSRPDRFFGIVLIGNNLANAATAAIAAMQALALALQDHLLKTRQLQKVMAQLPPLQTMESLLFQMLWAGTTLLALSIGSGLLFLHDILEALPK